MANMANGNAMHECIVDGTLAHTVITVAQVQSYRKSMKQHFIWYYTKAAAFISTYLDIAILHKLDCFLKILQNTASFPLEIMKITGKRSIMWTTFDDVSPFLMTFTQVFPVAILYRLSLKFSDFA